MIVLRLAPSGAAAAKALGWGVNQDKLYAPQHPLLGTSGNPSGPAMQSSAWPIFVLDFRPLSKGLLELERG